MDESEKARIKSNLQRMADQNAPREKMDAYLKMEGLTPQEWRQAVGVPEPAAGRFPQTPKTSVTVSEPPKAPPRTVELTAKPATPVEAVAQKVYETPFGEAGSFLGRLLPALGAAVTPGGPGFSETYAARRRAQQESAAAAPPAPEIKTPGARVAGEVAGGLAELGAMYGAGGAARKAPGVVGKVGEFVTATPMTDFASTVLGSTVTGLTDKPILGGATGLAVGAGVPTLGHFKKLWFTKDVDLSTADRLLKQGLAERIRARGEDPERIAQEIERLGPNATVMDASPALRSFFEEMIGRPTGTPAGKQTLSAQTRISDLLNKRLDPEALKGELGAVIDPTGRSVGAAAAKTAAEEAAAKAAVPKSAMLAAADKARKFFEGRQAMRPQVIQNEIGANLKPISNVEKQLDTWAATRKELNDQARESFLQNPLSTGQRSEFTALLEGNAPVRAFYEKFINDLRGVKEFAPFLPVDPTEARTVIARFEKATEKMTAEQKKQAEKVFLSEAEKKRYGSMDGVRDEATGTKNLTVDLADRIRQWTNESAKFGYDSTAADAAARRAMAEGQSIARAKLDEILRRGGESTKQYNEWLGKLADIRQKEDAVKLGRQIADGEIPADRVPILSKDMPPELLEAVKDGFVDAYARSFRQADPGKVATKAAPNRETLQSMEHLFGKQSSDKMAKVLGEQVGQVEAERSVLAAGATPETVLKRAEGSASEWGGQDYYAKVATAEQVGQTSKAMIESVDEGRKALTEGRPMGDVVNYLNSLQPWQKSAFMDGVTEELKRDPMKYIKAAQERKGDVYDKMVSLFGQDTTDHMTAIANRREVFGATGAKYKTLMETKPTVGEPSLIDEGIDLLVSALQAKVGFVGRGADYLKRAFVRPEPVKFPTVRQTGADLATKSAQEQADYVRSLLNYKPEGVFAPLAERFLAPAVKGTAIPGVRVFQPTPANPNLLGEELQRGERPL